MSDLSVTIGADLSNYDAALARAASSGQSFANNAANNIGNAMDKVVAATDKANAGIASSIDEIKAWDTAARNSSQRTTPLGANLITPGVTQQINSATNAVKNLNVQSELANQTTLSYSNRLQQMRSGLSTARSGVLALSLSGQGADRAFMAFGHHFSSLINETGSVEGAFKSLAGSLVGAGGIILAISLAVELWNKYTDSQDKAKEATKDYVDTLNSVRAASLKGQQDGNNEITRLRILYQATQDHTLSLVKRNEAYDELEKLYPKVFTNGDREKTLLGENAAAYQKLAGAILQAAQARAYEDKIGENSNKIFENRQKATDELVKQEKLRSDISKFKAQSTSTGSTDITAGQDLNSTIDLIKAQNKLAESQKAVFDIEKDSNKLKNENIQLVKLATDAESAANFKTASELDDKIAKLKKIKELTFFQRDEINNAGNKDFQLGVPLSGKQAVKPTKNEIFGNSGLNKPFDNPENLLSQMQAYAKLNQEKLDSINISQQSEAAFKKENDTIMSLTNTLGQGLVGAFESVLSGGQSLLSGLTSFLGQLIAKLIATAAAAAILAVILSAVGFGTGLGGAASEAGSFKSLFSSFSGVKLAAGGITNGPTLAMIGEGKEREAVMPLSKLQSFVNANGNGMADGKIVGILQGSNLLLQFNRANKSKQRIG